MSAKTSIRGSIEVKVYARSKRVVRLLSCPFCGYEFADNEHRCQHFLDEHDPEDAGLSGESDPDPELVTDGGRERHVPIAAQVDPVPEDVDSFEVDADALVDELHENTADSDQELVTDGGRDVPDSCPECGSGPFYPKAGFGFWCESCERELWRESDSWYSCDTSGDPELVTDGGVLTIACADCGESYIPEVEDASDHDPECPVRRAFINTGRWDDPDPSEGGEGQ